VLFRSVAIKRQAGRSRAAALVAVARDGAARPEEAAFDTLLLSAETGGPLAKSGAVFSFRRDDSGEVSLAIDCPVENLMDALSLVARELAAPSFSQKDLDQALREARVAARRELGDPILRARAELRSLREGGAEKQAPAGQQPTALGVAAPAPKAEREELLRRWSRSFGAERLSLVVVADLDPNELAAAIAAAFGALPRRGARPEPESDTGLTRSFKALPLGSMPGLALIRAELRGPPPGGLEFAAMTVDFVMLDELIADELGASEGASKGALPRSAVGYPYASVSVLGTADPASAKAAVDRAVRELASGLCLDPLGGRGALRPIALALEAYKSKTIGSWYSRAASSEAMAALIERDLATGGDGGSLFRLASRIAELGAEDLVRAAKIWILGGEASWVALGDPALVLPLKAEDFLR
jgi:hypothetical protein